MIFIGIGSNKLSNSRTSKLKTCKEAIRRMAAMGIKTRIISSFYQSKPIPPSLTPSYLNAVAAVSTEDMPFVLLEKLLEIERCMGRKRSTPNASRVIDLDLLAYNESILETEKLKLPHPRMTEREFVLKPLCQIAPNWQHPVLGKRVSVLKLNLKNTAKWKFYGHVDLPF